MYHHFSSPICYLRLLFNGKFQYFLPKLCSVIYFFEGSSLCELILLFLGMVSGFDFLRHFLLNLHLHLSGLKVEMLLLLV